MSLLKELYQKEVKAKLKERHKYSNIMAVPKLEKIVINRGLGEAVGNQKAIEKTVEEVIAITGQKPVLTKAKKAISNFKIREGQTIGCKVTLRSDRMYDFVTKLINIVLPKIRDFRGVTTGSFDGRGNFTLGIRESALFPEVDVENLDKTRGFDITLVTTAKTDKEAFDLLEFFGMPFRTKIKGYE